uniref:Cysteine proteinase inhibitor n=1 Tax=Picea sitchensis TaxID=3332 RepID=A9P1Q1_PICSI|nr:unknown [Picea sitchensis]
MQSRRQIDSFGVFVLCVIAIGVLGISSSRGAAAMGTLGGLRDVKDFQNSIETLDLGRFAVDEHNKQQNGDITFRRVVAAQEQVVAGTMYHLTIEAEDGDHPKLYKAKVWVKPWENFKRLEDFKPVEQPSVSRADLGVKQVHAEGLGWRTVPVHDPVVQEAAQHAVKNIQQQSNSLAAYELQEVLSAKAEVVDASSKVHLHLKTKRGSKVEEHKVEMHCNPDGKWILRSLLT